MRHRTNNINIVRWWRMIVMIEVYTSTEQVIRIFVYIIIGMVLGTYFRFIMAAVLVASRRD